MAKCSYCGTSILFGGVKDEENRFCNERCHEMGFLVQVADRVPQEMLDQQVAATHQGNCPKCCGKGPVDVHTSHWIWSALVLTSWNSKPELCCRSCGIKSKLAGIFVSGLVGWWGVPWGIIVTPIQLIRNVVGLVSGPNPTVALPELQNLVRMELAARLVHASRREHGVA